MVLTMNEAIALIVQFRKNLGGCWINELEENTLVKRFIQAGGASLDEEHGDKYLINENGKEILHPYIERISNDLIYFMIGKGKSCSEIEGVNWMIEKYGIDNLDTAEVLFDYIKNNLICYGYERSIVYRRDKKDSAVLIKIFTIRKVAIDN